MISTLNTLALEKTYRIFLSSPVKKQGNNIHSDIIHPGTSEEALIMKNLTIPLYFTLAVFSSYTCAVTPDNRAGVIRKNAQTVAPLRPSVDIKSKSYPLELDNNDMVVIPAGRTLTMPQNEARNIIAHMVNYNGIQEARRIKSDGDTFILE
ncbi:hypothetical protein JHW06_004421 [Salmonella enterica subsp. enterica serovar Infantis]|uniref:Uncharacterized protein n=2 Tax=Salmonella enterica TaxID=28901 RepID=A0A750N549_SALER|nr:hypothetical protein [Salmonella enterica subsp. enterica serovar Oranienburg]EED9396836.1 hypothetical protein [Salmonella enterica subsp. enterica serovar Oranienburg]EHA8878893.1 hypothetical protein [Salmonella enterica subsp. enterica serovar Infantis]HAF6298271.1 hypothetical protein [Salmonella enterica]HCA3583520.1 hypothetical protein [Salmonella enterica subsp. enterica serovar Java]